MLVIIGLIVGGILMGQNLIAAAAVRAQITQIEKFNTATNTFFEKYGYLPGDIPAAPSAQFGFAARGPYAGEGDGNGIIQGINSNSPGNNYGQVLTTGEEAMFWVDLSTANLIDGTFNTASSTASPSSNISATGVTSYMPPAKIGRGNYVYVWSGSTNTDSGQNLFGLAGMSGIIAWGPAESYPALSVQEAYSIDSKIDDGLPASGRVQALFITYTGGGTAIRAPTGVTGVYASFTAATFGSPTTCFDDAGSASNPMTYSVEISNGANINCTLSIRMQAGD